MADSNDFHNLFSSLISDIKSYSGKDPLVPWLRGIRKLKDTLPPQLLREKLPRFLQKCAETFVSDRRYANDLRYLRVWLQLMDFVDDPGAVLGTMKANRIGMKMSLFYQAYALYYEKLKRFEEAEKMYHLGAKNLAEPMEELQKSFEQFIQRMERHKNKKMERQAWKTKTRPLPAALVSLGSNENTENNENKNVTAGHKKSLTETQAKFGCREKESKYPGSTSNINHAELRTIPSLKKKSSLKHHDGSENHIGEDTVVAKFVGTAIVGKSEAEDACHHGLVEPTINTKEALNAINSMFQEPLEPSHASRRSQKSQTKADQISANSFEVFVDENLDNGVGTSNPELKMSSSDPNHITEESQPVQEPFQIYIDDDDSNDMTKRGQENYNFKHKEAQGLKDVAPCPGRNGSMFLKAPLESSKASKVDKLPRTLVREDTGVYRFVGSTISEEPQVENVCHHGLVEPTINLKEAMNDINSMFGKPIEFVRKNRPRKQQDKAKEKKIDCGEFLILHDDEVQDKAKEKKTDCGEFLILPDDEVQDKAKDKKIDCGEFLILPDDEVDNKPNKIKAGLCSRSESDLFEQTVCTKEAMVEINELFKMPLDF